MRACGNKIIRLSYFLTLDRENLNENENRVRCAAHKLISDSFFFFTIAQFDRGKRPGGIYNSTTLSKRSNPCPFRRSSSLQSPSFSNIQCFSTFSDVYAYILASNSGGGGGDVNCLNEGKGKGGQNHERRRLTTTTTTTNDYGIEQRRIHDCSIPYDYLALEFVCFTCSYRTMSITLFICNVSRACFHFVVTKYNVLIGTRFKSTRKGASATRESPPCAFSSAARR